MSESNGSVITLGRKGAMTVRLDDAHPPVSFDAVGKQMEWYEIDRTFRDENGQVPHGRSIEYASAQHKFVSDLLGLRPEDNLTLAEVLHFFKTLTEYVEGLKDFFEVKSPGGQSSPEPTDVVFST